MITCILRKALIQDIGHKLLRIQNRIVIKKAFSQFSSRNISFKAFNRSCKMSESSYNYDSDAIAARQTQYPIHPMLHSRTSPREMTGEEMTDEELMPLFEAARWAPSHYNLQEWRFVYAKRNTDHFQKFLDLLWPLNQNWAKSASVLVVVMSKKHFVFKGEKTDIPTHSFDAGSAWMSLALEGSARGYVVHAMGGVLYDKVYEALNISPETHNVDAMIAIGKRPAKESRKMDEKVTQRNPIEKFVSEGVFVDKDDN